MISFFGRKLATLDLPHYVPFRENKYILHLGQLSGTRANHLQTQLT
jgi:hypothetical protein